MKYSDPAIPLLLAALDEAFDHRSWHGTNLRGSLCGLTAKEVAWRPAAGRHNIGEIVVHAAYWKYAVRRLITGAQRGSFPLQATNWFARNEGDDAAWRRDLELLAGEHRQLRGVVARCPPNRLCERTAKKKYTYVDVIRGVAAHDLYHAGQIPLLKRLVK